MPECTLFQSSSGATVALLYCCLQSQPGPPKCLGELFPAGCHSAHFPNQHATPQVPSLGMCGLAELQVGPEVHGDDLCPVVLFQVDDQLVLPFLGPSQL